MTTRDEARRELEELERKRRALELWNLNRGHLLNFTAYTMPSYQINWHHNLICQYLMQWIFGDINKLAIFTPPRHGKSELVSRRTPAFILGHMPWAKVVIASYADRLASKMNVAAQRIMSSPAYRDLFPGIILPEKGAFNPEKKKRTDNFAEILGHDGSILSTGVEGTLTGEGATHLIIDDPLKNEKEAFSPVIRESNYNWWQATAETRLEDPYKVCLTMTRWHDDDLAGRLLSEDPEWVVLTLPAIATETLCKGDPRKPGEALWPDIWPLERLMKKKATTPPMFFEALYQQDPVAESGTHFEIEWWKYYDQLPANVIRTYQFWDCAQKPGMTNDFSVCATWAECDNGYYLVDLWRDKVKAPQLETMANALYQKHKPDAVVIEDASAGASLIQYLKQKTRIPVLEFSPAGKDKVLRGIAATPTVMSGRCHLPRDADFVKDFVVEHTRFPNGKHDDQVDTTSMMVESFTKPKRKLRFRTIG